MPAKKLTLDNSDFYAAGKNLGVEPAAIKAVATVESSGSGFYDDGFPTILFERHKFYKHAPVAKRDEWMDQYPEICNKTSTPKGGYGDKLAQKIKFNIAFGLDKQAAMKACSWGMFQELGENFADCGFADVGKFVDTMKSGAPGHLDIFVRSIKHRKLEPKMKAHDWAGFAENYNGQNYKKFNYDTKIAAAYEKAKKEKFEA
jgi:hypothetical protein